jgi:hypothetical protein
VGLGCKIVSYKCCILFQKLLLAQLIYKILPDGFRGISFFDSLKIIAPGTKYLI